MSEGEEAVTTEMAAGGVRRIPDEPTFAAPAFAPLDIAQPAAEDAALVADRRGWVLPTLAAVIAAGWTVFFLVCVRETGLVGIGQLPALIAQWAAPVAVIGVAWLLLARGSSHGMAQFGRAAGELVAQADQLEARLIAVNRELSLAREFIAAQSRELESIGRLAAERLGESGVHLQHLVEMNAERVATIAGVSRTALDNMEHLRAQLPVLTTSTRDLSNAIGSAGHAALGQADEMSRAIGRVGDAATVTTTRVGEVRRSAGETVEEFNRHADRLAAIAGTRLEALNAQGQAVRAQLDQGERQALAALWERTEALHGEGDRIAGLLRDGEADALARWRESVARIEAELGGALVVIDTAERDAFAASHARLLALSDDAERVDALIDERARKFASDLEARQTAQTRQGDALVAHAEVIVARFEQSEARMAAIATQGRDARDALDAHLRAMITALADGRETLSGADGDIRALTTSSERLRDLLDAAAAHGRDGLPVVLADSEAQVRRLNDTIAQLSAVADAAGQQGDAASARLTKATDELRTRLGDIAERQANASADAVAHLGHLEAIDDSLREIVELGGQLSGQARDDFAETLSALVRNMTETGVTAFDRALRNAAAQTAGRIEQAAAHAVGVGSEAASQLRVELAQVETLTAGIEARIAAAQTRAQTPPDREFVRHAALITEALNSNAIDIASALAQDLPDTAWAAYLRGDRGVFTRRAVRLLDNRQSRAVLSLYEADDGFRDTVSRYIHDFEAILRELLSARDGHVLAVTMLSSDLGKLYVALAQAIERLRA